MYRIRLCSLMYLVFETGKNHVLWHSSQWLGNSPLTGGYLVRIPLQGFWHSSCFVRCVLEPQTENDWNKIYHTVKWGKLDRFVGWDNYNINIIERDTLWHWLFSHQCELSSILMWIRDGSLVSDSHFISLFHYKTTALVIQVIFMSKDKITSTRKKSRVLDGIW